MIYHLQILDSNYFVSFFQLAQVLSWAWLVWAHAPQFSFKRKRIIFGEFTFMHLVDDFIQSDLQYIQAIHFVSMCSLGIEPTTFALLKQYSTTEPQVHSKTDQYND